MSKVLRIKTLMIKHAAILGLITWLALVSPCWAETSCQITVPNAVEVEHAGLMLSDVLPPTACQPWMHAASAVRLGALPLTGSVRVLDGADVRRRLESIAHTVWGDVGGKLILTVPPRIVVHRSGQRSTCSDIAARLAIGAGIDCGVGDRIPADTSFQIARRFWDPASRAWHLLVRCDRSEACAPFLVKVRTGTDASLAKARDQFAGETPLVHRGQKVDLLWDRDGIRLLATAMCLEEGGKGAVVRARIQRTGRVMSAVVSSSGELRVVE